MTAILRFILLFLLAPVFAIVAQAAGVVQDDFRIVDTVLKAESVILENVDDAIFKYDTSGALLHHRSSINGEDDLNEYEELETSGAVEPLFSFLAEFVAANNVKALPAPKVRGNPNTATTYEKIVVDPKGNAIPLKQGESLTGSPDGRFIQVRDASGNPTGLRIDGPHKPASHPDPRAQVPHAHVPGVTNPDGTPWLPVNQ